MIRISYLLLALACDAFSVASAAGGGAALPEAAAVAAATPRLDRPVTAAKVGAGGTSMLDEDTWVLMILGGVIGSKQCTCKIEIE
jgi:hypothetical protein